jgi:membrane carboxypeptidase/penicillin-binding protein
MHPGGTGYRARIPNYVNQAGKTGTINSNHAVWFVGYTPLIAASAMIAIDPTRSIWKHYPRKRSGVAYFRVPSTHVILEGSGSGDAGMKIWQPAMTAAMKGQPDVRFKAPPDSVLRGKLVQVPSLYGLSYDAAKRKLERAGFTVVRRNKYNDTVPKGTFMGFSPDSGAMVPQFSTIFAQFSNGKAPAAKPPKKKTAQQPPPGNGNPGGIFPPRRRHR